MVALASVLASITVLGGFLLLTRLEAHRGVRLFERTRVWLDTEVRRLTFIITHVDFESFTREQVRTLLIHLAHDTVHVSLLSVRAVERLLSRMVKQLRIRHGIETVTATTPRAFVKTMSDFKRELSSSQPPVPEI